LVDPITAFILEYATPADAGWQVVLILASDLTGFAARAAGNIDVKS
jgi:thiamine monophosphate kinase